MNLQAEILSIEPGAKPVRLGRHEVFYYQFPTPTLPFTFVLQLTHPSGALLIKTRSGYSELLAEQLLDRAAAIDLTALDAGCITVVGHSFKSACAFQSLVLVPPAVAKCFEHQSPVLNARTTWVFPAYDVEFRSGQTGLEFSAATGKAGRIEVMHWDRLPTPQVRIQLLTDWPGGMLRRRKQPAIIGHRSVPSLLSSLPLHTVQVKVLDLADRELVLHRESDRFAGVYHDPVRSETFPIAIPVEQAGTTLEAFFRGAKLLPSNLPPA